MSADERTRLQVYGLASCDSCRHARKWLEARRVPYAFHDLRADGIDAALLQSWLDSAHGPYLLNRRSTTWRNLSDEEKAACEADPLPFFLNHPALLKRPVIADEQGVLDVGFSAESLEDYI